MSKYLRWNNHQEKEDQMIMTMEKWVIEKVENLLYLENISNPKESYQRLWWEIADVVSFEEFLAITEDLFEKRVEQKAYVPQGEYKSVNSPQKTTPMIPHYRSCFFCKYFICRGRSQINRENTPIFICALHTLIVEEGIQGRISPAKKSWARDVLTKLIRERGVFPNGKSSI